MKLDIILEKKKLGLFFKTRQCRRTYTGVQKRAKIGKNGDVFLVKVFDKFWKGHDGQITKKRMQKCVFRV